MSKIKVLIIDDSALIRQLLTKIFSDSDEIEVVGTAADPIIARDKIKKLNPDVLTLDVEMPKMDGLTFLSNLMRLRPMPVVMISTLTEKGAEVTLEALRIGAVDFVAKPKTDVSNSLAEYAQTIVEKVKAAAQAKDYLKHSSGRVGASPAEVAAKPAATATTHKHFKTTDKIVAVGSSTGGTEAFKEVIRRLPRDFPAIVLSQHLPVSFSLSFAKHVDDVTEMHAMVATDGQPILPGHIYIAPGDKHLTVTRDGARYVCSLEDGPPVNRHKPSVDVMFRSIAKNVGCNAIGVMLTGMGADGALGMKEMLESGSTNIVQDQATSVVWGMPGEAYKVGAAHFVLPIDKIAEQIIELI